MDRENFASKFGALVVIAGSAVGLGNVWRFPYVMGNNGGAAFILLYIFFVVVICVPIMMSEFVIGRKSRVNAFRSMYKLVPQKRWKAAGLLYIFIPTAVLSYYSVIGGWTMQYMFKSLTFSFGSGVTADGLAKSFESFSTSPYLPVLLMVIFLIVNFGVVMLGVQKGLEKFSKVMMPALFVLVTLIAVRSLTLPGAEEGIRFLFKPDFSKVTGETLVAALGQAFFSLSMGSGVMMTYGSYLKQNDNLTRAAGLTAFFDLLFAIIAGCAVMPAVFAFNVGVSQGPGLVFQTLPLVFSQMPLGNIVAIVFFISLFLAAWTSSMSQFEVPVSYLVEEKHISRKTACMVVFLIALVFGTLCALSFGVLSGATVFGKTIFDALDALCANYLMPLGGLLAVIFVGWRLKKSVAISEITNDGSIKVPSWFLKSLLFIIRFVAPVAMVVVFLSQFIS